MAPSWTGRELVRLPLLKRDRMRGLGPLLGWERRRGLDPLQQRKGKRRLGRFLEMGGRRGIYPLLERERKVSLVSFWRWKGGVVLAPSRSERVGVGWPLPGVGGEAWA